MSAVGKLQQDTVMLWGQGNPVGLSGFFALLSHRGAATPTPQASVSPLGILMLIGKVLSGLAHEFLKHSRIAKKRKQKNLLFGSKAIISHPPRTMSSIKTHLSQPARLQQFVTPVSEVIQSCSMDFCLLGCFLMDIP